MSEDTRDRVGEERLDVAGEVLEAQADLQTALGFFRLERQEGNVMSVWAGDIEDRLARSLARLHRLLDDCGRPMYSPATHPAIEPCATQEARTDG